MKPPKTMAQQQGIQLGMLAALAALLAGCQFNNSQPDGSGTIECTQVQVAPLVGGRLIQLIPQEGAKVKKGEVVARLDDTDYRLRLAEARAALTQAQAQLDLLLAGSRAEDIQAAREKVRELKALAAAAQADWKRIRQVVEMGSGTAKQLDDAKAAVERAEAAVAAAEQTLERLLQGPRKEEIEVARAAVELAKARIPLIEKNIADCTVAAPMDGVVTVRSREEGEVVPAGGVLLTLSRLDEVWLSVYIPETRLSQVKLGQPARVRVDGLEKVFVGRVTYISPEAEFTPRNVQTREERARLVYRVKITLSNPEGIFKPGMPADGFLDQ